MVRLPPPGLISTALAVRLAPLLNMSGIDRITFEDPVIDVKLAEPELRKIALLEFIFFAASVPPFSVKFPSHPPSEFPPHSTSARYSRKNHQIGLRTGDLPPPHSHSPKSQRPARPIQPWKTCRIQCPQSQSSPAQIHCRRRRGPDLQGSCDGGALPAKMLITPVPPWARLVPPTYALPFTTNVAAALFMV